MQSVEAISKPHLGLHILLTYGNSVRSLAVMLLLQLQAIVLAPNKALPHVAACISMGRLAVFSDNKTKVRGQPTPFSHPLSQQPVQYCWHAHVPEAGHVVTSGCIHQAVMK